MTDTNINSLLEELNESTIKCNELCVLTETIDEIQQTISTKLSNLKDNLLKYTLNVSKDQISENMLNLIDKVNTIKITEDYKIYTYPNIHGDKNYNVDATVLMAFVTDRLNYNLLNDVDYDKSELLEEAVAFTYKKLTGESVGSKLPIDKFKEKYRAYCIGGVNRTYILPNTGRLTKMAIRSPYIIYFTNQSLNKHINSLNKYSIDIRNNFKKVCDKKPELMSELNKYIDCVEDAIKYTVRIYKDISSVLNELDSEYRRIFREIVSIDNTLSSLDESIDFDSFTIEMNKFYKGIISSNVLMETNSQESNKNQLESLNNLINNFIAQNTAKLEAIEKNIDSLKGSSGLIINITQDMCNLHPVHTYSNINSPINSDIIISISELDSQTDYKNKLQEILSGIDSLKDCYENPGDGRSWILTTCSNIRSLLCGNTEIKIIDVESLANNLMNIPKIMKIIYDNMVSLNNKTYNKLIEIKNKLLNCDCNNIENDIKTTVVYYNMYSKLLDCIYNSLDLIIRMSIDNINEIMNKE